MFQGKRWRMTIFILYAFWIDKHYTITAGTCIEADIWCCLLLLGQQGESRMPWRDKIRIWQYISWAMWGCILLMISLQLASVFDKIFYCSSCSGILLHFIKYYECVSWVKCFTSVITEIHKESVKIVKVVFKQIFDWFRHQIEIIRCADFTLNWDYLRRKDTIYLPILKIFIV